MRDLCVRLASVVCLGVLSFAAGASPRIALNVDGQSNYSYLAPWANIAGQLDANNATYWTGYIDGDYKVSWTGSGTPTFTGGRSTFQVTGANQGILHLAHNNPGPNGGGYFTVGTTNVANLQILAPDAVPGTPFRKPFLDKVNQLVHGSVIRYMDWMQTVGSPVVNWSDRNTSMYQTSPAGVNYDNIVALSNYTHADAWINIPAEASDDYVRQLARFLKTNLNPTLNVYIEYSNELWNGGDGRQGTWNLQQARSDPQFNSRADDTGKMALRAAERLRQSVEIFKQEFGSSSRLRPEIGGFIANSYWAQWQVDWLKSKGVNLKADNYHVAIAPYVPGSPGDLGENPGDSKDAIIQKLMAFMNGPIKTWIQQNKAMADAAGLKLDSYEADIGSFYGQTNLQTHLDLQNDPRLGDLEKQLIQMWDTESGGGLYNTFGLVSPYSEWGQWGLLNDVNAAHSVKWDAVASLVGPLGSALITQQPFTPEPSGVGVTGIVAMASLWRRWRRQGVCSN
ncbi:MAG TPA: hypothetical protein VH475_20580 [Tepidisphaeraceae bacterium]|jgi:hypothetical protein